ncbi:hypothetical protein EJE24_14945 [Enterobacter huaxiensis]|uniref:Uncharacterized protein n=1 Tax=Enterobacter huaxiensis TaxID=2494702 RepID=A0A428LQB6_9ENTR|nr:hypothetical protein EJE24_14945 [Enterobacter huaxiensis]
MHAVRRQDILKKHL